MTNCPFCDAPLHVTTGPGEARAKCTLCGERIDAYDEKDLARKIKRRLVTCNPEDWRIKPARQGRRRS